MPSKATIEKIYDNLDRVRGTVAFLDNVGAVSMHSVCTGLADAGAKGANRIALFAQLMDSQTLVVTANTSTLYAYTCTDLANDGPTVIEIPPGMLGFLDDGWQRFVGNMGVTGPDKGQGGKYLVLPPGYTGTVPEGYFLLKPTTNKNFLFLRGSIKDGLKPAVDNITSKLRVYPLKDVAKPAPTEFVDMSGQGLQYGLPQRLQLLRESERGHPGRTHRRHQPRGARRDRRDRHRQGPAVQARCAHEEAADRGRHAGQRHVAGHHLPPTYLPA